MDAAVDAKASKSKKIGGGGKKPTEEESIPALEPLPIPDDLRTLEDQIAQKYARSYEQPRDRAS